MIDKFQFFFCQTLHICVVYNILLLIKLILSSSVLSLQTDVPHFCKKKKSFPGNWAYLCVSVFARSPVRTSKKCLSWQLRQLSPQSHSSTSIPAIAAAGPSSAGNPSRPCMRQSPRHGAWRAGDTRKPCSYPSTRTQPRSNLSSRPSSPFPRLSSLGKPGFDFIREVWVFFNKFLRDLLPTNVQELEFLGDILNEKDEACQNWAA